MLEGFYCPDGVKVKVADCLQECRIEDRCQELPDLVLMSQEREFKGVPSTTQLINGTMMEFLKLTKSYYIDPDSRVFMLSGTRHHQVMDEVAKQLGMASEVALSIDRDIFDLITWTNKGLCLVDRKEWGSYKVAKALGIAKIGEQPDPSGAVYKTNSKYGKAGDPKMIPVWGVDPSKADNWEAELQLNRYRVLLFERTGLPIADMCLRVKVRDGGLYIAKDRGVFRNSYRIPIKFLPDQDVRDYFKYKEECLLTALEQGHWELPCTAAESWEGVRCEEFCDVWQFCPKGQLVHGIGGKSAKA